jgi:sarcosine oxidase subunit alpha
VPRLRPPRDPVTIRFDGQAVVAERGEPIAVALVAAGHLVLARSPKFHRPRGPACQRAACDGCLARVDDVPNMMTCRTPAAEGTRVETQNVVGSRDHDLLGMADWFFPAGMNHHELFAGVPGVQRVMQAFARRVAGLGKLPREVVPPRESARRDADVLVVGAGPAGMATALGLAARGRRVEVVDDDLVWGGSARALVGVDGEAWAPLLGAFERGMSARQVTLRLETTAAAIYGNDVLVAGHAGVEVVTPRVLVLAPGAHDGVLAFDGNDGPAVMSARAAGRLLGYGVTPGAQAVVVVAEGGGPFGEAFARAEPSATLVRGVPVGARGSGRVHDWTIATPEGERRFPGDVLLVDAPRAPAYELCAQAGAELGHQPYGFIARVGPGGRIRDGVFAVGEVVGTPLQPDAITREAERVVAAAS